MRHYAAEHRAGAFANVTDHFEEVVGRAPEDFATIARRYLDEPWRIAPGLTAGRARASSFVLRLIAARTQDLDRWERTRDYPLIRNGQLAHENPDWVAAAGRQQLLLQPGPADQRVETRRARTDHSVQHSPRPPHHEEREIAEDVG